MSKPMDQELRDLIEQCKVAIREGAQLKDQIDKALAWGADNGRLTECEKAVEQITGDLKAATLDIEKKMDLIRNRTWDANGRYRGVWDNEDQARAFGMFVMARCAQDPESAARNRAVLKSEYGDIHERSFGERAMASNPDESGGALIIPEFSNRLVRLVEQFGVMEEELFPMPMSSDSVTFMRRKTGLTVYLVGENTAGTESAGTYGNVSLSAKEWGTLTYYPKTLGADAAVMIGELIAIEIAQAFAEKFDDIVVNGDGSSTYFGVTGFRTGLTNINGVDDGGGIVLGTGNAWSELTEADHNKVLGRAPTYAHGLNNEVLGGTLGGKWIVSLPYFWEVMARITNAKGGVTAGEFEGRRRLLFYGYPVKISQKMPVAEANSSVCALFGAPRLAGTVGRRTNGVNIEQSTDYKFAERQVAVLGTRRVAANIHELGTSTAAGPVVGLITAAG